MSPEQCRSASNIDARSDIYSLGCVLFELVTGRTPFTGDIRQQIEAHKRAMPPTASSFAMGEIPPQLDDLIAQMLAKDPNARPQSMEKLQARLYALNAELAGQSLRVSAAHVVSQAAPHAALAMPVPVAPGVAATILPTAASLMALGPSAASTAALPAQSPIAMLAQQNVQFAATAPQPVVQHDVPAPLPRTKRRPSTPTPVQQPRRAATVPYHLSPHLPSLKKAPVRAGIAGAAIAFLIAAFLTAVAARGRMKAADASPTTTPSVPTAVGS
jgi:serine/threonine-protein kinase